jgi:hypothetical protein
MIFKVIVAIMRSELTAATMISVHCCNNVTQHLFTLLQQRDSTMSLVHTVVTMCYNDLGSQCFNQDGGSTGCTGLVTRHTRGGLWGNAPGAASAGGVTLVRMHAGEMPGWYSLRDDKHNFEEACGEIPGGRTPWDGLAPCVVKPMVGSSSGGLTHHGRSPMRAKQ